MNKELLKQLTVLYVEDEDEIRVFTSKTISTVLKKVLSANDGVEGVELFKQHSDEIDLIITDINMPKMDGLSMCSEIKKINPNIPIVITSAYNDNEFLKRAIELGVNSYAIKPIDLYTLVESIIKAYEPIYLNKKLEISNFLLGNELDQREKELKYIIDAQDNLVFIIKDDKFINSNNKFLEFFNAYSLDDLKSLDFNINSQFIEEDGYFFNTTKSWIEELLKLENIDKIIKIKDYNNEIFIFSISIDKYYNDEKQYIISFTDITKAKDKMNLFLYKTNYDSLTGLLNKNNFLSSFNKEIRRSKRYNNSLSLLLFSIDNLKDFKDKKDSILVKTANLLENFIREHDSLVKWDKNEFLMTLPHTSILGSKTVVLKIKELTKDLNLNISFAIGVLEDYDTQESILDKTTKALIKAKEEKEVLVTV